MKALGEVLAGVFAELGIEDAGVSYESDGPRVARQDQGGTSMHGGGMGNSFGARRERPAPMVGETMKEPSSARGRPVLRLITGGASSKRSSVSTAPLRLVLN